MESEALAEEPEDSVVCDMQHVMRMMELALRNVDVAYDDENVYYTRVWNKLRGRLLCLLGAATSAGWKPEFLAVLKGARFVRKRALLPFGVQVLRHYDKDSRCILYKSANPQESEESKEEEEGEEEEAEEEATRNAQIRCVACAGSKALTTRSVNRLGGFELVGRSAWCQKVADGFLLTCPPPRLRERLQKRLTTDQRIEHQDSGTNNPNNPNNPNFRGFFVAGPKCSRLAFAFVWVQNFLSDLAHRIEEELERGMTEEQLSLPPDDVSVVTKEMARFVVLQLERMETFLREDVDREVKRVPPKLRLSPDDDSLYTDESRVWDKVSSSIAQDLERGWKLYCDAGEQAPDRPAWVSEEDRGKWTEGGHGTSKYWVYHRIHNGLNRARESLQTQPQEEVVECSESDEEVVECSESDEDSNEDDEATEATEADARTLRRKRRERTMQVSEPSEPPPRRRRTAVVEDDDDEEEAEEEEAAAVEVEAAVEEDAAVVEEAVEAAAAQLPNPNQSEMQLARVKGQEVMLCELLRRAHESAAH